jgi:nucleoside-diphosphate-sugar epimerase
MKTILILGASGFVGKNFLNNVQASKYNILCPYSDELDLLDKSAITSYLKNNRPDISKMKSIGYVPKTAISEGIQKTIEWYKKNTSNQENLLL